MSDRIEITRIDDESGHGLGRVGQEWVAVPFSAVGDVVDDALNMVEAGSKDRQQPPCTHFGTCGGCQLQHLGDGFVAGWKRGVVGEALSRQGLETAVDRTVSVPAASRRRAKFTLQRTKKADLFGFIAQGTHTVVDLEECPILAPKLLEAIPDLRVLARLAAPRKRAVTLHATASLTGLDVHIEGGKELDLPLRERVIQQATESDIARLTWDDDIVAERRRPAYKFGKTLVYPPPGTFLQAARETELIVMHVLEQELGEAKRMADLFCGCGTFSVPLAERGSVAAYDADEAMVDALRDAARRSNTPLEATTRDLFRRPLLKHELDFEAVVFDPPRPGAKAQAEQIAMSDVPLVIGVSCNPRSFARDAKLLTDGGYALTRVVPVDQFRWSPHIEVVGVFRRG